MKLGPFQIIYKLSEHSLKWSGIEFHVCWRKENFSKHNTMENLKAVRQAVLSWRKKQAT